jgi:hypothetical protein
VLDATSGDRITFTNALAYQTIILTGGQIFINQNLNIDASAIGGITIDGNGLVTSNRIFEIASGVSNQLDHLELINGLANGAFPDNYGGAIGVNSGAELALNQCTVSGNTAEYGTGKFTLTIGILETPDLVSTPQP